MHRNSLSNELSDNIEETEGELRIEDGRRVRSLRKPGAFPPRHTMSLQEQLQRSLEGKIDFEGQKLADLITRYVLMSSTVVSFLAGFFTQSLTVAFSTFALAVVGLVLAVIPPWPLFNKHPVAWLPKRQPEESKKSQ